jgi:hypothetical protein
MTTKIFVVLAKLSRLSNGLSYSFIERSGHLGKFIFVWNRPTAELLKIEQTCIFPDLGITTLFAEFTLDYGKSLRLTVRREVD